MALSDLITKMHPQPNATAMFLALILTDRQVTSCLWQLTDQGGELQSSGEEQTWGGEDSDELIAATDASIATAIAQLTTVSDHLPDRVILGLPEIWTSSTGIQPSKLTLLQKVCQKNQVKPLGFVVTTEAIADYLKEKEGGIPNFILIDLAESDLAVSLIAQGKYLGTKVVGRSDNLPLDVEEGLLRFGYTDPLPSRLILTGSLDLDQAKQALISYPWIEPDKSTSLNFLQLPIVEIADHNLSLSSLAFAGGREIRPTHIDVSPASQVVLPEVVEPIPDSDFPSVDFGFSENEMAAISPISPEEPPEVPVTTPFEDSITENVGEIDPQVDTNVPVVEELPVEPIGLASGVTQLSSPPGRFRLRFPSFHLALPKFRLSFLSRLLIPLAVIVLVCLIFLGGFYFLAKADVKLYVQPQLFDKQFDFTVSTKTSAIDSAKMIIPANKIPIEVTGSKSTSVVGKKVVGDKASGEFTIYNRTDLAKTLPRNTVIKGPNGLKFVTKEEVKVGPKTADLDKGIDKWGEIRVPAEASDIGTQYNFDLSATFSFDTTAANTSLLVKAATPFSGGTSREIQAVGKEDREGLSLSLTAGLSDQAKSELKTKLPTGGYLLESSLVIDSKTERFNHEVGDEASQVSLDSKILFSAYFYKDADFQLLADKIINPEVPDNFDRDTNFEAITYTVKDKDKLLFSATIKTRFLPKLDLPFITTSVAGKTIGQVGAILKQQSAVTGHEITLRPSFFAPLRLLPFKTSSLRVMVVPL